MDSPEKIVRLFERRRHLEAGRGASLRIDRTEHVTNGPVLPCGIPALQDDQECDRPSACRTRCTFDGRSISFATARSSAAPAGA